MHSIQTQQMQYIKLNEYSEMALGLGCQSLPYHVERIGGTVGKDLKALNVHNWAELTQDRMASEIF